MAFAGSAFALLGFAPPFLAVGRVCAFARSVALIVRSNRTESPEMRGFGDVLVLAIAGVFVSLRGLIAAAVAVRRVKTA